MSSSVKLLLTGALIAVLATAVAICLGISWFIRFQEGIRLSNEGYVAEFRGDHDEAILKLTAALQKPLLKSPRSRIYLNRGIAHNWKSQFDDAIRDFSAALRDNSELVEAYSGRGLAYQRNGQLDKALADLNEAIQRDPNSPSASYNRAFAYYTKHDLNRAIPDSNEAVRCNPSSADPLILRGLCYLGKNDLNHALADFDGAIAVDPRNPNGYQQRSDVYSRKGDWEKSRRDLTEAIHLRQPSPAWTATITSYQLLLDQQNIAYLAGDFDRAIDLSNQILIMNLTPAQASLAVMRRGSAYVWKNQLEEALQDHNEAIRLDSRNAAAYFNRGLDLAKQGKVADAINDYSQAIRIEPNYALAFLFRAALHRVRSELDQALADITRAIELNPKEARNFVERAQIYLAQSKPRQAIDDCSNALKLDPASVEAHIYRAKAYSTEKNYAQALQDIEAIPNENSKETDVGLNSLAWFRATCREANMRDGKKAVTTAIGACELSHWQNWAYIDTLAAACAEAGQFDEAVKYEKQALQMMAGTTQRAKMEQRLALYEQHKPYRE